MSALKRWLSACGAVLLSTLASTQGWAFSYSGYVDTSYNYLVRRNEFITGEYNRYYDLQQNGFTLQQAGITAESRPKQGAGGLISMIVGRDAYQLAPYGWNPYYGSQTLGMLVPQAYAQYTIQSYLFSAGIFESPIGTEFYAPTRDSNFSRSILYGYAEPGIYPGARATYVMSDVSNVYIGINNGWSGFRDRGRQKSLEYGLIYQLNPMLGIKLQGLSGQQRLLTYLTSGPTGYRTILNLIATLTVTDALTLTASADYGAQSKAERSNGTIGRAVWEGLAGYVQYKWQEKWRVTCRGEWYDDRDGYTTTVRQNWRELTLTLGHTIMKHLELRAETRHDFSNVNAFVDVNGRHTSNNQQSYAIEALYSF